jgi:Predicted extracellular nuclease
MLTLALGIALTLPVWAQCGAPSTHTLAALKGNGTQALPAGRRVTVEATVSAAFVGDQALNGFYLQADTQGIFVYAPALELNSAPAVGERWRVQARTGRYRGRIQLEHPQRLEHCGDGSLTTHTLEPYHSDNYERFADQPVRIEQSLSIADAYWLGRYGSLRVALDGRAFHPGNGVDGGQLLDWVVDDGSYRRDPRPLPHAADEQVIRAGDVIAPFTGIMTYAFGQWRIHPLEPLKLTSRNPRPPKPDKAASGTLRAVNFNLYNYFIDRGGRGAQSPEAFARQRQRLRTTIQAMDADILALHEVQNAPAAVADLVAYLNANQPTPAHYQAAITQRRRAAIRSVLLYRPARLTLEQVQRGKASVHPREPLAGTFSTPSGRRFAVAVAHFKSRGGCPDDGDTDRGEGCWADRRQRQAEAMSGWLQDGPGKEPLLLLADFNSYATEAAMQPWWSAGYSDLIAEHIAPQQRYTYIYRGQSGYLDHALATPTFARWVKDVRLWPINADEPAYRAQSAEGVWRASDHDPIMVDWNF